MMETAKIAKAQAKILDFITKIAKDVTEKESAPYVMGRERTSMAVGVER